MDFILYITYIGTNVMETGAPYLFTLGFIVIILSAV